MKKCEERYVQKTPRSKNAILPSKNLEFNMLTYKILIQQFKLRNTKTSKRNVKFTRTIPGN